MDAFEATGEATRAVLELLPEGTPPWARDLIGAVVDIVRHPEDHGVADAERIRHLIGWVLQEGETGWDSETVPVPLRDALGLPDPAETVWWTYDEQ